MEVDEVLLVTVEVALLDVDEGVVAMVLLVDVVDVIRDLVDVAVDVDMTAVFTKHLQALLTRDILISCKDLGTGTVEDARYFGQKAEASWEKRSKVRSALSSKQTSARLPIPGYAETQDKVTPSVTIVEKKFAKGMLG